MSTTLTPASRTTAPVTTGMHVVMVDEELPYPPNSGKRIRTLNLTERLARKHRVTFVCNRSGWPHEGRLATEHFAKLGIRTVIVDRTVQKRSGVKFYARLAANLLSPLPYSVTSHDSPRLREALQQIAREEQVDLWHFEWTPYAEALRGVAGPRLVMAHNVESVIWQRYYLTEKNPLKKWYIGKQWRKFERFERTALGKADMTVAVSEVDADRFRNEFDVPRVEVVDNGVDTAYFCPQNEIREPATLLFVGSLEWRPNLDGVAQMIEQVFPAVRREEPDTKLVLVGRNPPAWLARLVENTPNVELHGNVPDVRPFLARAGMLVVPLRIGGGSRLKILEALSSGTPVVSTRVGAEGLDLVPGQHFAQAEEIGDLVDPILTAIRDPLHAREQADAGRSLVVERYDWDRLANRLDELWTRCARGAARIPTQEVA